MQGTGMVRVPIMARYDRHASAIALSQTIVGQRCKLLDFVKAARNEPCEKDRVNCDRKSWNCRSAVSIG